MRHQWRVIGDSETTLGDDLNTGETVLDDLETGDVLPRRRLYFGDPSQGWEQL